MRRVRTGNLQPGMKVARTVFNLSGNILLNVGVELKRRYIKRLREFDIPAIYVVDDAIGEFEVPEPVSEKVRIRAMKTVKRFMQRVKTGSRVDTCEMSDVVDQIMDQILADPEAIVNLRDIRSYDDYTFAHSVQVAILSLMTANELGLNKRELHELGLGGLLHDLGKVTVDEEILNKPDKLTTEEYEEVKRHPRAGFDMIRRNNSISLLSAHVAFQHHERLNGSGYPRGLKNGELHLYGKIAAVADVYDAMTADRVYNEGVPPHQAASVLCRLKNYQFQGDIVEAFLKQVALYPVGTNVVLSNGYRGLVIDINRDDIRRPIVRLTRDPEGKTIDALREVDLMKEHELAISGVNGE